MSNTENKTDIFPFMCKKYDEKQNESEERKFFCSFLLKSRSNSSRFPWTFKVFLITPSNSYIWILQVEKLFNFVELGSFLLVFKVSSDALSLEHL